MDRQQEKFFTIQQISLKLKIPKPTLRFWEKELDGILVPLRSHGGQRRYTVDEVSIIDHIKKLRRKGLSIAEIRSNFGNNDNKMNNSYSNTNDIDVLANRVAEVVKQEVHRFFEV